METERRRSRGRDSLTAALRETKEELGIDLEPQKHFVPDRIVSWKDRRLAG